MNLDLEAMKAAALAATPGEWHAPGLAELHDASNRVIACFSDVDPVPQEERPQPDIEEGDRNARFAALAYPAAVLALIERLERTEQDNRALLGAMHRQTRLLDHAIDEHAANAMLIEENDRLQRELDAAQSALLTVHRFSFSPGQPEFIALDRLRVFVEEIALGVYAGHQLREKALAALGRRSPTCPSAVRGLLEQNGEMRSEIEAAMNKTDCATGLRFRPIIPEAVMRRCERPYAGPVNPGDVFAWEPDIETARELLVVTRITKETSFPEPYEERVFTRPIDGGKKVWNDMGRFREAVVPTLFRPWLVEDEVRP